MISISNARGDIMKNDEIKKKMIVTKIIIDVNKLFLAQNSKHDRHSDYDNKTILSILNYINSNLSIAKR